jgi:hypothetical protein
MKTALPSHNQQLAPVFGVQQRRLRQGSWLERGYESHPPSWAVPGGTRPPQRRREAGLETEEDEPTGRNESEPQIMTRDSSPTGDQPSPAWLGEGRWERVGPPPASAQHSGGVGVDSTSGRPARVTGPDSGEGRESNPTERTSWPDQPGERGRRRGRSPAA